MRDDMSGMRKNISGMDERMTAMNNNIDSMRGNMSKYGWQHDRYEPGRAGDDRSCLHDGLRHAQYEPLGARDGPYT